MHIAVRNVKKKCDGEERLVWFFPTMVLVKCYCGAWDGIILIDVAYGPISQGVERLHDPPPLSEATFPAKLKRRGGTLKFSRSPFFNAGPDFGREDVKLSFSAQV